MRLGIPLGSRLVMSIPIPKLSSASSNGLRLLLLALVATSAIGCNRYRDIIPEAPNPEDIPPTDPYAIETFYQVNPDQAESLIKNHPLVHVLDFRTAEAYEAGHLPGAIHFPWNDEKFLEKLQEFDKSTPILAYSDLNQDAFQGIYHLRNSDYLNVYWLSLGFPSWVDAGKSIQDVSGKTVPKEKAEELARAEKEAAGVPTES